MERLEDPYGESEQDRVAHLRASIIENVSALVRHTQPERAETLRSELFKGVDDVTFVNSLSNAFALPAEDKQGLLEADSIPERFRCLSDILSFRRAEFESAAGSGPARTH